MPAFYIKNEKTIEFTSKENQKIITLLPSCILNKRTQFGQIHELFQDADNPQAIIIKKKLLTDFADNLEKLQQLEAFKQLKIKLTAFSDQELTKINHAMAQLVFLLEQNKQASARDKQVYAQTFLQDPALKLCEKKSSKGLGFASEKADLIMDIVYFAGNALVLGLSVASLLGGNANAIGTLSSQSANAWNGVDGIGAFIVGIDQLYHGQSFLGLTNLVSGGQLLGFTIASIAGTATGAITAVTSASMMGLSFAGCMMIAAGLEAISAIQADNRVQALATQLNTLDKSGKDYDTQYPALYKAMLLERAQFNDHYWSFQVWTACSIAMTAVAIAGIVAASTLSFGTLTLPAIAIATSLLAAATGIFRLWTFHKRTSNVSQYQESEKKGLVDRYLALTRQDPHKNQDIFKAIEGKLSGLLMSAPDKAEKILSFIETPDYFNFLNDHGNTKGKKGLTFEEYICDLLIKDPGKVGSIKQALNDEGCLKQALAQHRNTFFGKGLGKTRGQEFEGLLDESELKH